MCNHVGRMICFITSNLMCARRPWGTMDKSNGRSGCGREKLTPIITGSLFIIDLTEIEVWDEFSQDCEGLNDGPEGRAFALHTTGPPYGPLSLNMQEWSLHAEWQGSGFKALALYVQSPAPHNPLSTSGLALETPQHYDSDLGNLCMAFPKKYQILRTLALNHWSSGLWIIRKKISGLLSTGWKTPAIKKIEKLTL